MGMLKIGGILQIRRLDLAVLFGLTVDGQHSKFGK